MTAAPVTVIIPAYKGLADLRACIESVWRHGATSPYELVVIDDCSPEPEVSEYLEGLGSEGHDGLTVLRNVTNLGFVATVNRGFGRASGDVVVLNADTVVTAGWLDRLADAARAEPDVATVTPLTNFGSICTLPGTIIDAFSLAGDDPAIDECARFVAAHGLGLRPDVITGVGFCMYVTAEALEAVGPFDARTFGRGYGEEVDFCLRATRLGFRHLVEDRTFVYHRGGGSFGSERDEGLQRGALLIRDRYPFFRATNQQERRRDPLAVPMAALELGLHERDDSRPHVLHVLHSAPNALGGTEKHLATLIDSMLDDIDFCVIHPVRSGFNLHTRWRGPTGVIEQDFLLPGGPRRVTRVVDQNAAGALRTALDMFHFDAVHIQNLIGHSLAPLTVLADYDGSVVCSVRDPYLACPSHALLYEGLEFCALPSDLSLCERCLPRTAGEDLNYLRAFRRAASDNLDAVDHWVFASQSAADLFLRAYDLDDDRIEIIPHGAIVDLGSRRATLDRSLLHDEPLRVAFVGLGRAKKGLDTVNWLADRLAGTDIEIHHFGALQELASDRVLLHGGYDNAVLPRLLDEAGIHVVLLPGVVYETFGHVLTESLVAGRPVIAAHYGALAERLRASGAGWTVDPTRPEEILELVVALDRCRDEVERATTAAQSTELHTVADTASRYRELYLEGPS